MKVTMSAESKRIITLGQIEAVKRIIADFKEDTTTAAEYAASAVRAAGSGCNQVYEATATIAKNQRVWNAYSDESADIDIWIDATARTMDGFVIVGAYLTDIWSMTGDNNSEVAAHMYIRKFAEIAK